MKERVFSGPDGSSDCCASHPTLPPSPSPSIPSVFLHVSVVDIDQLQLIMTLVGSPGPELLMKISSEFVSVKYHPAHFCHAVPFLLVLLLFSQTVYGTVCIAPSCNFFALQFSFCLNFALGLWCFPACAVNYNSIFIFL